MSLIVERSILVVDDDAILRGAIRFELEMAGALVAEAAGGHAAFNMVKNSHFDLVLSDVRMPDGDGFELLDNIHRMNPKLPVVLLISDLTKLTDEELAARGCAAHLPKPFDPEFLVQVISDVLKKNHPF